MEIWCGGENICRYKTADLESEFGFEWNLFAIIDWFCQNLDYIIGYDPFPLPVKGENGLEYCINARQVEISDSVEQFLWYNANSRWIFRHCWFCNRDGAVLPCLYFWRNNDTVEIFWDNAFWCEHGINFLSKQGIVKITPAQFKNTILSFLLHIISAMDSMNISTHEKKTPLEWKQQIFWANDY